LLAVSAFVADVAFVALVVVAEVVAGKTFSRICKSVYRFHEGDSSYFHIFDIPV